jgi:TRAP transporter TAXI family solute receptor
MKKMRGSMFLFIILTVFFFSVVPSGAAEEPFPKILSFGTGGVGGAFNMVGVGIAKYWDKDLGIKAKIAPGLALGNLRKFGAGKLDMIVTPSTWDHAAWQGLEAYGFKEPIKNFRVLCGIYPTIFHFIALKSSGLKTVADLKGKRVNCGPKAATFDKILGGRIEANGLKFFGDKPDFKKMNTNWNDGNRLLADGNIDATLTGQSGLSPMPSTRKLMEEKELVALEWSDAALAYKDPVFPVATIKGELLPYINKDFTSVNGGIGQIVVRADFSDALAYALTKVIYENLDKLAEENPFWRYSKEYPETLTADNGMPFHPGAVKYWKEAGVWKR